MHSNFVPNCNYYSNFCANCEFYSDLQSNCKPPICCCCPICRKRRQTKPDKMPPKPRVSNGTPPLANKAPSKIKSKSIKSKRASRPETQEERNSQLGGVDGQGINLSENGRGNASNHSLPTNSPMLKKSDSFCRNQCCCGRLDKSLSKQKLNLNIPVPKNQTPQNPRSSTTPTINSVRRSTAANQQRLIYGSQISGQVTNHQNQLVRNSLNKRNQTKPPCCTKIQSLLRCGCCNNNPSPTIRSPQISLHSFRGSKSNSQLDVIDEEDSDIENNQRRCNSTDEISASRGSEPEMEKVQKRHSYNNNLDEQPISSNNHIPVLRGSEPEPEKVQRRSSYNKKLDEQRVSSINHKQVPASRGSQAETEKAKRRHTYSNKQEDPAVVTNVNRAKSQKSLEDSCADFLNIVCDNIKESVEECLDLKLKEFGNQAAENLKGLSQKLEDNEAVMRNLFQEMAEKMTEQNKTNTDDFYARIQELIENQSQTRKIIETHDKESQCSPPTDKEETKNENISNFEEPLGETGNENTTNLEENISNMKENISNIGESISLIEEKLSNNCHDRANAVRCAGCQCCFEELGFCHPCCPQESGSSMQSTKSARECGGCLDCTMDSIGRNSQKPPVKVNSLTTQNLSLLQNSAMSTAATSVSSTTINYCSMPSGKINFNCNSPSSSHQCGKCKMKSFIVNKKGEVILNSPLVSDNYETSGYATEPEDNIDAIGTIVNNGRKRLQKKAVRQQSLCHKNSFTSPLEGVSERSSTQSIRTLSRVSLRSCSSSPTRLSRL